MLYLSADSSQCGNLRCWSMTAGTEVACVPLLQSDFGGNYSEVCGEVHL